MTLFVKTRLQNLADILAVIIEANSERYTYVLADLNEQIRDFPDDVDVTTAAELLARLIDITYQLTAVLNHATHANYFLDQHELNVYTAFKLIESLELDLAGFSAT